MAKLTPVTGNPFAGLESVLVQKEKSQRIEPTERGQMAGYLQLLKDAGAGKAVIGAVLNAGSPLDQAKAIVKNLPSAEIKFDVVAGNYVPYITYKDKNYAITKQGLTGEDVAEFLTPSIADIVSTGGVMGALKVGSQVLPPPLRALAQGALATPVRRATVAGTTAGATDLSMQNLAQILGGEKDTSYLQAGATSLFGGFGQNIGENLAKKFGKKQSILDNQGRLKPEVEQYFIDQGLNTSRWTPDILMELDKLRQQAGRSFFDDAVLSTSVAKAESKTSGIPTTKGQQTGDVNQLAREYRMRAGASGDKAATTMREFDLAQAQAIKEAQERLQAQTGRTTQPTFTTRQEQGSALAEDLRKTASTKLKEVDKAYEEMKDVPFSVMPDDFNGLAQYATDFALAGDRILDPKLYPEMMANIKYLRELTKEFGEDSFSLGKTEQVRRVLSRTANSASNDERKAAALTSIKAFDTWLDDLVEQGKFLGDETAVTKLKDARAKRTEYGQLFEPSQRLGGDTAGRSIEQIIKNDDVTSPEIVNKIFGNADVGGNQNAYRTIDRLVKAYGADSPEVNRVREAVFYQIINGSAGDPANPLKVVQRIDKATKEGSEILNLVFNGEDLGKLFDLRTQLSRVLPPDNPLSANFAGAGSINRSGSAYELSRGLGDLLQKISTGGTLAATGDPVTAGGQYLLQNAMGTAKDIFRNMPAKEAVRGATIPNAMPNNLLFPATSAAAGSQLVEQVYPYLEELLSGGLLGQ